MVRLVADCGKVPAEAVEAVETLKGRSKAYIRRVRLVGIDARVTMLTVGSHSGATSSWSCPLSLVS